MKKEVFRTLILLFILIVLISFVSAEVINPPNPGDWITVFQPSYNGVPCGSGSYVDGYNDYCGDYFDTGSEHHDGCGCWQMNDGRVGIYCCDSHGSYGIRTCTKKYPSYDSSTFTWEDGDWTINCLSTCTELNWYKDADGDDYSDGSINSSCFRPDPNYFLPVELIQTSGDCNDTNPNIYPGVTEICNGVDDDCDGEIDEGGVCLICNGGAYAFIGQTNWEEGSGQTEFIDENKYSWDNGHIGISESYAGSVTYLKDPTEIVEGYDTGWKSIIYETTSCAFDDDSYSSSSSCPSSMISYNPNHTFYSYQPIENYRYTFLAQRNTNPKLGFTNKQGNINLVNNAYVKITLDNLPPGDYYVSIDGEYSGSSQNNEYLTTTVNGGASGDFGGSAQTSYDPNYLGDDKLWWSCYNPQLFSFTRPTGQNKISFWAKESSVHLDAYRITKNKPIGIPKCYPISPTYKVNQKGELFSSIMDKGLVSDWQFLEIDKLEGVGENIEFYLRTASTSAGINFATWQGPYNNGADLTSFTQKYTQYKIILGGLNNGNPVLQEIRFCEDNLPETICDGIDNDGDGIKDDGLYSCLNNEFFEVDGKKYCFDCRGINSLADAESNCAENNFELANYLEHDSKDKLIEIKDKVNEIKNAVSEEPAGLLIKNTCSELTQKWLAPDATIYWTDVEGCSATCMANLFWGLNNSGTNANAQGLIGDITCSGYLAKVGAICQKDTSIPQVYCTGSLLQNTELFSLDENLGLTYPVNISLVESNTSRKCEARCSNGYHLDEGVCVVDIDFSCTGDIPNDSILCENDANLAGLSSNVARDLVGDMISNCTPTKCEYYCRENYVLDGGVCVLESGIKQCYDNSISDENPDESILESMIIGKNSYFDTLDDKNWHYSSAATVDEPCVWKCTDDYVRQGNTCVVGYDEFDCVGTLPAVGEGKIIGSDKYYVSTHTPKLWSYVQGATGDMNCIWTCNVEYIRFGNACRRDDGTNVSDVNNIEFLKLGKTDKNIVIDVQCSNNLTGLGVDVINEQGKDINQEIIFISEKGIIVTNGNLNCNTTSTKYILKSNQTGLDTYVGNQKYLITASIKQPCAICMRSGYIFYGEEIKSSIPDANILVVLLVACFVLFIMQRKRI